MKKKFLSKCLLTLASFTFLSSCENLGGGAFIVSFESFDPSTFSWSERSQISFPEMYEVSYELNGGTYIENPVNCYNGIQYLVNLEQPWKEGYMFGGWYMDANFTTKLEDADPDTTGDITLYAKWVEIPGFTVEGYNKGTKLTGYTGSDLDVVIPEGITIIDSYVFMGREDLTSIQLPTTLEEIGNSAFRGCSSIESFDLPSSLEIIGDSVFCNCYDLKNIVIGNNVEEIGDFAFQNCWALEEVTLGDRLGVISDYMFANCGSLKTIHFGSKGNLWKAGDWAFKDCVGLEEITFPSGFMTFTFHTLDGCRNLTKVVLPSSMGYIGESCFGSCANLPKIWIPKNVIYVGSYAFEYCNKLTIYCECTEREAGRYQSNWNASRPVVWESANIN